MISPVGLHAVRIGEFCVVEWRPHSYSWLQTLPRKEGDILLLLYRVQVGPDALGVIGLGARIANCLKVPKLFRLVRICEKPYGAVYLFALHVTDAC